LQIRRLELQKMTGEVVNAESVRRDAFRAARIMRDRLLALPERVSAIIAAIDDPHEVHRVLLGEVRQVCDDLSQASTYVGGESEEAESEKA
jgi:hypothetical protein